MATSNRDPPLSLWEEMIESKRDFLCDSIEITEKFKNLIPKEFLARDHWEEIEHSPQMKKKVGKFLDILSKREKEEAFTVLARSLWKSEQSKPAKKIDPHELYRSKVIAWFCANEYQANAAMSVLSKFVGGNEAVGTRVPRAISTDQNVTYCKVEAWLDDWNSRYVGHKILLSYPESEEKAVIESYVRDVERRYKPNYVVHIGTAVSQDPDLTVGSVVIPSKVDGVCLLRPLADTMTVNEFCRPSLAAQQVLKSLMKEWKPSMSYSSLLCKEVMNPGGRSVDHVEGSSNPSVNSQLFLAAEKASLGKVTLVTGENGSVDSLAFTPNDTLIEKARQLSHRDDTLMVYDRPFESSSPSEVFPKDESTYSIIKELSKVLNGEHRSITCVHSVSSMFENLDDYLTERVTMEIAGVVAIYCLSLAINKDRMNKYEKWLEELSKNRLK